MSVQINLGCGRTPTAGWRNFDNTPAIKLSKSPIRYSIAKVLGQLSPLQVENIEWNKQNSIEFADATKNIPFPNGSVNCIYTSHMFEHLSREGAQSFLNEALRVLCQGGVLRISVPDVSKAIDSYQDQRDADQLMSTLFVTAPPISGLRDKLKLLVSGYRHHQWMYDGDSLSKLLSSSGFKNVSVQDKGNTLIENSGALDLFERSEESVYVEGVK